MDLAGLFQTFSGLNLLEKRQVSSELLELVFFAKDQAAWLDRLTQSLGPAFKALNESPSAEAKTLADSFGGIRKNQAMFKRDEGENVVIALLWPWENQEHITLKIFNQPLPEAKPKKGIWPFGK